MWLEHPLPAENTDAACGTHAAASMRGFRIHELTKWVDSSPDLVTHERPFWKDGYFTNEDKPGPGSRD